MTSEVIDISIAEFIIRIVVKPNKVENWSYARNKIRDEILDYCKNFIVVKRDNQKIDFYLDTELLEVIFEKKRSDKKYISFYDLTSGKKITTYNHISIFHFQHILKTALYILLTRNNGYVFHSSAANINGKATIFLGPQGSGKSTTVALLHKKFPALADDTSVVRREGKNLYLYQGPFFEKQWWIEKIDKKYLVDRIFFLRKANYYKIEKITDNEYIFNTLLKQVQIEENTMKVLVKSVNDFVKEFSQFYCLYFAKNHDKLINLFTQESKNL